MATSVEHHRRQVRGDRLVDAQDLTCATDPTHTSHEQVVVPRCKVGAQTDDSAGSDGMIMVSEVEHRDEIDGREISGLLSSSQRICIYELAPEVAPVFAERCGRELHYRFALELVADLSPRRGGHVMRLINEQMGEAGEERGPDVGSGGV
jgi:hypothetical protein